MGRNHSDFSCDLAEIKIVTFHNLYCSDCHRKLQSGQVATLMVIFHRYCVLVILQQYCNTKMNLRLVIQR